MRSTFASERAIDTVFFSNIGRPMTLTPVARLPPTTTTVEYYHPCQPWIHRPSLLDAFSLWAKEGGRKEGERPAAAGHAASQPASQPPSL